MKRNTLFILTILLPIQVAVVSVLAGFPTVIEHVYSTGLYPIFSKIQRFALGWFPFSFGDLLYTLLIVLLIRWIVIRIKTRFRQPKLWIVEAGASLSVFYAAFHLFWGLNYYRLPLHKTLKIDSEYTTEELVSYTEGLVKRTNALHINLVEDDTQKTDFQLKKSEIRNRSVEGYRHITNQYPALNYSGNSVKPSLFSIPLTYMGFNGYLNPLTNEAQVNNRIPKFKLPSTTSHEIGHQLGFAKENEANFMACLTTMNHPDAYFRYAGHAFALNYCLGELYQIDSCLFENFIAQLNEGVRKDYREVQEFWEAHKNPFEPFFKLFYGNYLKINNQSQGMKSYNYVVALLVNYSAKNAENNNQKK